MLARAEGVGGVDLQGIAAVGHFMAVLCAMDSPPADAEGRKVARNFFQPIKILYRHHV
jgi:hypothetical protein